MMFLNHSLFLSPIQRAEQRKKVSLCIG